MPIKRFKNLILGIIICSLTAFSQPALADWLMRIPASLPEGYEAKAMPESVLKTKIESGYLVLRIANSLYEDIKDGEPQHLHFIFNEVGRNIKNTQWVYIEIPPESYKPGLTVYAAKISIIDPTKQPAASSTTTPQNSGSTLEQPVLFTMKKVEE